MIYQALRRYINNMFSLITTLWYCGNISTFRVIVYYTDVQTALFFLYHFVLRVPFIFRAPNINLVSIYQSYQARYINVDSLDLSLLCNL